VEVEVEVEVEVDEKLKDLKKLTGSVSPMQNEYSVE